MAPSSDFVVEAAYPKPFAGSASVGDPTGPGPGKVYWIKAQGDFFDLHDDPSFVESWLCEQDLPSTNEGFITFLISINNPRNNGQSQWQIISAGANSSLGSPVYIMSREGNVAYGGIGHLLRHYTEHHHGIDVQGSPSQPGVLWNLKSYDWPNNQGPTAFTICAIDDPQAFLVLNSYGDEPACRHLVGADDTFHRHMFSFFEVIN